MNNTAPKKLRAVCCVVVMLAILASITLISAIAASHGIYIAAATSHYRHPRTGVIEDSGGDGSYELGLSMTQSATYNQATGRSRFQRQYLCDRETETDGQHTKSSLHGGRSEKR